MIYIDSMESPVGIIRMAASERGLCFLTFRQEEGAFKKQLSDLTGDPNMIYGQNAHIVTARVQLQAYFEKKIQDMQIPLHLIGTSFQVKVWEELLKIPYGQLYTYGDVAERLGGKNYSRAVGSANRRNPLPIIVPCHRVIREGRRISNYSGGLDVQRILFEVENIAYGDIEYL